ncbi:hypothetical protein [Rahnella ecdela]|uniref:Uncharacterized protein n=1 Tax=Rahnella ecdela TaxID=2816250 RepID=A0ABS6L9P9_9GAMM|nr:hypothetical protein [Rahnella ecdela]MBU9843663.1 hypothetical protein [Rahnella ecdela]
MTDINAKTIDISSISKTSELLCLLLQKIEEAECDSLPGIYKKLITLNETLEHRDLFDDGSNRGKAFNLTVDIEEQIFEQIGYAEETHRLLRDLIENLDILASSLHDVI